ncbi:MAG: hypothetical protein DBX59_01755 [Bacillota bacterium]|nr:MAG: hypothetical protein DBX59_01755 [Bacillota bacterium]
MTDKPAAAERELPEACRTCESLHKKYASPLCEGRRRRLRAAELWRRFLPIWQPPRSWECDLRKYRTVEDIEREEEKN